MHKKTNSLIPLIQEGYAPEDDSVGLQSAFSVSREHHAGMSPIQLTRRPAKILSQK